MRPPPGDQLEANPIGTGRQDPIAGSRPRTAISLAESSARSIRPSARSVARDFQSSLVEWNRPGSIRSRRDRSNQGSATRSEESSTIDRTGAGPHSRVLSRSRDAISSKSLVASLASISCCRASTTRFAEVRSSKKKGAESTRASSIDRGRAALSNRTSVAPPACALSTRSPWSGRSALHVTIAPLSGRKASLRELAISCTARCEERFHANRKKGRRGRISPRTAGRARGALARRIEEPVEEVGVVSKRVDPLAEPEEPRGHLEVGLLDLGGVEAEADAVPPGRQLDVDAPLGGTASSEAIRVAPSIPATCRTTPRSVPAGIQRRLHRSSRDRASGWRTSKLPRSPDFSRSTKASPTRSWPTRQIVSGRSSGQLTYRRVFQAMTAWRRPRSASARTRARPAGDEQHRQQNAADSDSYRRGHLRSPRSRMAG